MISMIAGTLACITAAARVLLLMTALTLLPAILLMMTSFTRIVIVLSLLRQALGQFRRMTGCELPLEVGRQTRAGPARGAVRRHLLRGDSDCRGEHLPAAQHRGERVQAVELAVLDGEADAVDHLRAAEGFLNVLERYGCHLACLSCSPQPRKAVSS